MSGGRYPRVYRLRRGVKRMYAIIGSFAAIISIAGVVYFAGQDEGPGVTIMMIGICAAFLAMGICMILAVNRIRVTLRADTIEVRGVFTARHARRGDFDSLRIVSGGEAGTFLRLLPRESGGRKLDLPSGLDFDARIDEWLAEGGIVNLDAKERQASLDQVLGDRELPGSVDEKLAALASARRIGRWYLYATLSVLFWALIRPRPYDLVIVMLALLPWIGALLIARRGSLYKLDGSSNEMAVIVGVEMWIAAAMLALRAFLDTETFDIRELIGLTLAGAGVVFGLLLVFVPQVRGSSAWLAIVMALLYAYGCVALVNRQWDAGNPQIFRATVTSKRAGNPNELGLGAWGPPGAPESVVVTRGTLDRVEPGSEVCVYVWPGALRVRWIETWQCPAD